MTIKHNLADAQVYVTVYHPSGEMESWVTILVVDLMTVRLGLRPGSYVVVVESSRMVRYKELVTVDG